MLTLLARSATVALAAALLLLAAPLALAQDCCPTQTSAGVMTTIPAPFTHATPQASPQGLAQGPCCPFPQGYCPFPQGYCPPPNSCGLCARPLGEPKPYTPRPLGMPCPTPQALGSPQGAFAPSSLQSYPVAPAKRS